jgi:hypothetical protein
VRNHPDITKTRTVICRAQLYNCFWAFGCKVWMLKTDAYQKTKFDSLAWEGVFIGYANDYSSYKVIQLYTKEVMPSLKHGA